MCNLVGFDDDEGSSAGHSNPCMALRAIVAERMRLNVMVEERKDPAGTGVGEVIS